MAYLSVPTLSTLSPLPRYLDPASDGFPPVAYGSPFIYTSYMVPPGPWLVNLPLCEQYHYVAARHTGPSWQLPLGSRVPVHTTNEDTSGPEDVIGTVPGNTGHGAEAVGQMQDPVMTGCNGDSRLSKEQGSSSVKESNKAGRAEGISIDAGVQTQTYAERLRELGTDNGSRGAQEARSRSGNPDLEVSSLPLGVDTRSHSNGGHTTGYSGQAYEEEHSLTDDYARAYSRDVLAEIASFIHNLVKYSPSGEHYAHLFGADWRATSMYTTILNLLEDWRARERTLWLQERARVSTPGSVFIRDPTYHLHCARGIAQVISIVDQSPLLFSDLLAKGYFSLSGEE